MIRLAVVGLGKMGLSHLSMINAHPDVKVVAICDSSKYILDVLGRYSGIPTFSDYEAMLKTVSLDAIIIATPSRMHAEMVREALKKGLHVLCEKPFCLNSSTSEELALLAESKNLVNQVGYHYRFVGAFQEVKRILDSGAMGAISHVLAEAYGPVVLRPKGLSWRTQKEEGGGCLYDYAAHPINLLNWYFGQPESTFGTVLSTIFSRDTDDEVYSTLRFANGPSAHLSVNWSDESYRKMSVKLSIWGANGRLLADRQECHVYLRDTATPPLGYGAGWTVRYTTELTEPVWFYVRGEEYSAQLDYFVSCIAKGERKNVNSFVSAAQTDVTMAMLLADAQSAPAAPAQPKKKFSFFG
jgi:predicted dehydrogenase